LLSHVVSEKQKRLRKDGFSNLDESRVHEDRPIVAKIYISVASSGLPPASNSVGLARSSAELTLLKQQHPEIERGRKGESGRNRPRLVLDHVYAMLFSS